FYRCCFSILTETFKQVTMLHVYGEAESALLPCFYGGSLPEKDPSVIWSRNDRNPKVFHLRPGGDDPEGQNQIYKGRTSMTPDALQTRNFSLTFSNLLLSDSGNYICSISDGIKELKLTEVQLNVKGHGLTLHQCLLLWSNLN
uniref:Ig-like domain-containing protein n=1 Tax=Fundulus heteroclitus TaxID=8078 RepID=A0A3Q2QUL1_FUNHE